MKNIEEFLLECRRLDIKLWTDGNRLCYRAPEGVLSPAILSQMREQKGDIIEFLLQAKATIAANSPPIVPVLRSGNLPLSFAQERLWFLEQLEPNNCVYNIPYAIRLTGLLNVNALEQSLIEIAQRHEILRTAFPTVDGQPVQVISPDVALKLPVANLRELSEPEREDEIQRLTIEHIEQPFDLAQGPLWRFKLLRLAEEEYILLLTIHHIIFDGKSFNTFFRELSALYQAFSNGMPSPLPELPIQYADFAVWQQQWQQSKELESQIAYWQQKLGGSVPALELPIKRPRPAIHTYQGSRHFLVLPENLTNDLNILSLQEGVTLFMTLLAGFKTFLYCYTKQEDILLASPVTGHKRSETEALIGYFNNILLMRTDLSGNPSFRELIGRVRQTALEAYQNQNVPLQKLGEMPNLARTPLSRGMFALHHITSQPLELPGLTVSFLDIHNRTANFDLSLLMEEKEGTLTAVLEYKTALFEAATITQMVENFKNLLESLVTNPEQRLSTLPLLRDLESHHSGNSSGSLDKTKQKLEEAFVAPKDDLEIQLTKIWENVLGKKSISIKDNFFDLGGHSLLAVQLSKEIAKAFQKNLPLAALFQEPTIEGLANIIRDREWSSPWFSLVPIQPIGDRTPLFAIHLLGEGLSFYRPLASYLGRSQPIYGLNYGLAARNGREEEVPLPPTKDLAAHYIREMQAIQPQGPYLLSGVSNGGNVAFEMAKQLHAQGQMVAKLILFDTIHPNSTFYQNWENIPRFQKAILEMIRYSKIHWGNLLLFEPNERLPYILDKVRIFSTHWLPNFLNKSYLSIRSLPHNNVTRKKQEENRHSPSPQRYIPQNYPGKITLFKAKHLPLASSYPTNGWEGVADEGLEIYEIHGAHSKILSEPSVRVLAKKLKACLVCIDKALEDDRESYNPEPRKSTMEVEDPDSF